MSTENIQVAVRFRPSTPSEADDDYSSDSIWSISKTSVLLRPEAVHSLVSEKRLPSGSHPSFQFDHAFLPEDDNFKIYTTMVRPIVLSTLDGFNATVFAYGQTGSGKTYTMLGLREDENDDPVSQTFTPKRINTSSIFAKREELMSLSESKKAHTRSSGALTVRNRSLTPSKTDAKLPTTPRKSQIPLSKKGIIVFSLEDIFHEIKENTAKHYFFSCSYIEIYNEHVYDLLKETQDLKAEVLTIIEGTDKEFCVRGLSEHAVASISDVLSKLEKGEINRHYAATNLNHNSSRSHTIFRLNIKSLQVVQGEAEDEKTENLENVTTESILNFVDLAGSERVGNLQAISETDRSRSFSGSSFANSASSKSDIDKILAESKNINTSLFYLCQVISKLAEQKLGLIRNDSHIPFRNSNLTKILRSSLGGNARTCILCTATPICSQFEQTISTLRFGSNARSITNKVKANVKRETSAQILIAYEQDASVLRRELELLTQRSKAAASENQQIRQKMEARLKRLTQMLYEKTKDGTDADFAPRATYGQWANSTGDLISAVSLTDITAPAEKLPMLLKCDEDGLLALTLLRDANVRHKENQYAIAQAVANVQSMKSVKVELRAKVEKGWKEVEDMRRKKKEYKLRVRTHAETVKDVRTRVNQYEHHLGFDRLSEHDLECLEATFLIALDKVKQTKAKNRVAAVVKRLQDRLLQHLSAAEVNALMDECGSSDTPGSPERIVRDISSIKGSPGYAEEASFEQNDSPWSESASVSYSGSSQSQGSTDQ